MYKYIAQKMRTAVCVKRRCLWLVSGLLLLVACVVIAGSGKVRNKLKNRWQRVDVVLNLPGKAPRDSHLLCAETATDGLHSAGFWIAHGGGVGEYVYTNCEEAVRDSLARGFRYIELDLLVTSDGCLVGGHDWPRLRALVGAEDGDSPLSKAGIDALRPQWKKTPLFAGDICRLMQENPEMVLVTDKIQDFDLLLREIPYPERMVIEAFGCHNCLRAFRAGFRHVALSAWSVADLELAEKYRLPGVVLAAGVVTGNPEAGSLLQQMHRRGCCIMVHGSVVSDQPRFVHEHLGRDISRIYTDTWSPAAPPPAP